MALWHDPIQEAISGRHCSSHADAASGGAAPRPCWRWRLRPHAVLGYSLRQAGVRLVVGRPAVVEPSRSQRSRPALRPCHPQWYCRPPVLLVAAVVVGTIPASPQRSERRSCYSILKKHVTLIENLWTRFVSVGFPSVAVTEECGTCALPIGLKITYNIRDSDRGAVAKNKRCCKHTTGSCYNS